jgi:hypothetical protein
VIYRNPWTTCWASYQRKLWARLQEFSGHFGTVEDTETAAEFLQQATDLPLMDNRGQEECSLVEPTVGEALLMNQEITE